MPDTNNEPTNRELLEAIQGFGKMTQTNTEDIKTLTGAVGTLKDTVSTLTEDIQDLKESVNVFASNTEQRLKSLESDMGIIKSQMVTKEYLDEKINNVRGDLVALVRKEDDRVTGFVDMVHKNKGISTNEAVYLNSLKVLKPLSETA